MDNNQEYVYVEAESNGNKGLAITLLVLGIVSCVLSIVCCCPGCLGGVLDCVLAEFVPFVCGVVGIILYLVKKTGFNADTMKLAKAGFICSIVGIVIVLLGTPVVLVFKLITIISGVGVGALSSFMSFLLGSY